MSEDRSLPSLWHFSTCSDVLWLLMYSPSSNKSSCAESGLKATEEAGDLHGSIKSQVLFPSGGVLLLLEVVKGDSGREDTGDLYELMVFVGGCRGIMWSVVLDNGEECLPLVRGIGEDKPVSAGEVVLLTGL